jgi:hypothetical protein
LPDSLPSAIRSERRNTWFMSVGLRVDWKAVMDSARTASAQEPLGVAPQVAPQNRRRRHLPQRRAVIRESTILTDPHPVLPRAEANVPYLGDTPSCCIAAWALGSPENKMRSRKGRDAGREAAKRPFRVQKTLK